MIWFTLITARAMAEAGHGAEHAEHAVVIPWASLLTQTFNVVFLAGLLVYLLRKPAAAHFAKRAEDYRKLVTSAEAARVGAEEKKRAIEAKLARLEAESAAGAGGVNAEADALRAKLREDGKADAVKIDREARFAATLVTEKARAALRRDLLGRALSGAKETLRTGLGSSEQQRLQNEFAEKIQVVGQ